MRLVSLNTWMGVVREPLLDFFSAHKDVDIFCLQEIYKDAVGKREEHPTLKIELELFERIQERLEDTHSGVFKPAVEDYYGLAIFHKNNLKILEEGEVSIYDNPTWEASISQRGKHSRNLQYIRLLHAGSPLLIANVHGLWTGEGKGDTPERLEQSRRIQDFLMRKYELK
ncbi:MAG: endonuclease/exonuclease/phosphatase family protein, partial [Minisyncoccia bacterium]